MKKLFLFASAAAVLATSCSDDLGLKNPQAGVEDGNARIIATYPVGGGNGTRISLGQDLSYQWDNGDALGIYGIQGGVVNATFKYVENSGNQFSGNVSLVGGDYYYGYYPKSPINVLTGNNIEVYIPADQNYNSEVVEGVKQTIEPLSGSFSQGEAPAVAYGPAVKAEDGKMEISMQFQAVAGYMVFPVTSITPVTVQKLELTVSNPSYNTTSGTSLNGLQYLAGGVSVNMASLAANDKLMEQYPVTNKSTDANTTITLYCGSNGVEVGGDNGLANFWFVVPAGLYTEDAVATCKVYFKDVKEPFIISKTLTATRGNAQLGANNIKVVTAENRNAWTYNNIDPSYFAIQTEAQFIEYAYLVTKGKTAIEQWIKQYKTPDPMDYSSLPQMLNYAGKFNSSCLTDGTAEQNIAGYVSGIKNALVTKTLDFSNNTIKGLTISNITGDYYKAVYESFLTTGYIPTIGGGNGFVKYPIYSIEGYEDAEGNTITLKNLKIQSVGGNALFYGQENQSWGHMVNLSLENLEVQYPEFVKDTYYPLLAANSIFSAFENVTVNGGSVTSKNGTAYSENMAGLFGVDYSSRYLYKIVNNELEVVNNVSGVTNNSGLQYANKLYVNGVNSASSDKLASFYFTIPGQGYEQYNNIQIDKGTNVANGEGATLHINGVGSSEDSAAALMNKIATTSTQPNTLYSVVDQTTSYWTGMSANGLGASWINKASAEGFATQVQYATTTTPGSFTKNGYDLNLMGSYNTVNEDGEPVKGINRWWNKGGNMTVDVTKKGDVLTISNVYIDGTKEGETAVNGISDYQYLTLLGQGSTVNNLVVDGIIIEPAVELAKPCIALISSYPNGNSSNITVQNVTENIDMDEDDNRYIGGLYWSINTTRYNYLSGNYEKSTADFTVYGNNGEVNGVDYGYLAGNLTYDVTDQKTTIVNPVSSVFTSELPFGVLTINIDQSKVQTPNIFIDGFGTLIDESNVNTYIKVTADDNYSFVTIQNGVQQLWTWVYNKKGGTIVAGTGIPTE